ncbi:hypothetical protein GWI33_020302 [Rhynchophorus ferrugineus]|uniref:Uncharacterized protein n=1 Tax=Rhynchophorus ferrugineus TaxID=354439 RepID=A0A834HRN5_RHYFE|nr:hypothetical protein GWI33_020302 [Rhynchophorus ferrugineus]
MLCEIWQHRFDCCSPATPFPLLGAIAATPIAGLTTIRDGARYHETVGRRLWQSLHQRPTRPQMGSDFSEVVAKIKRILLEDRRVTRENLVIARCVRGGSRTYFQKPTIAAQATPQANRCHYVSPETKEQSKQWRHPGSPRAKKFKQSLAAGKIMATGFWDREAVLLTEFVPQGTTINLDRYCATLTKLKRAIQNRRRERLTKGCTTKTHVSRQTTTLLDKFG